MPKQWWQRSFASFLMVVALGFFIFGGLIVTTQQFFGNLSWFAGTMFQSSLLFFVLSFYFACVESLVLRRFTVELWLSSVMALVTAAVAVGGMNGIVLVPF